MSHLATADSDEDFAKLQLERFRTAAEAMPELEAHVANSAAVLRYPQSRFTAARCGVALYGLSPFGTDPAEDGSSLLQVAQRAGAGEASRRR